MITVSLNEIRAQGSCTEGWEKVLRSKGGAKADIDAQFPMTDILESNGFDDTLWCLRCRPEYSNLWRKYAVWCARKVQHLMTDQRSIAALNVALLHSNGEATDAELAAAAAAAWGAAGHASESDAWDAARAAAWSAESAARAAARAAACDAALDAAWVAAWAAAWAAARDAALDAARDAAWDAAWSAESAAWDAAWAAAREKQQNKLIEILTAGKWID